VSPAQLRPVTFYRTNVQQSETSADSLAGTLRVVAGPRGQVRGGPGGSRIKATIATMWS